MELWQLDIVDGIRLADGSETKIVTGFDDHSGSTERFSSSAYGTRAALGKGGLQDRASFGRAAAQLGEVFRS